jgi:hypothetical protein
VCEPARCNESSTVSPTKLYIATARSERETDSRCFQVRVTGTQRVALRDDVAALFLTHRAFGIDTVSLISVRRDQYYFFFILLAFSLCVALSHFAAEM